MKKMRKIFGIIAIVAVIGFAAISMIGCSSPSEGGDGKPVASIEITTEPTKLRYNLGEDLDTTGMVVTATYTDGTKAEVTGYEVTGYDKTKAERQIITVTYKGKTDEFSVNVIDPSKPTVAKPTANPPAGNYTEEISVELSTTTPGATIYYTIDGSEPTEESDVYEAAIDISETTTIKAFAVLAGYNDSDELEAEYILILPFTSAPELSLEPDNGKITYTWEDSDPVADSYDVYWKEGSDLTADEVKAGTKISGATSGGAITGLTNGTSYSVIVTANKASYTSIDSEVETAIPSPPYIITGSGTTFTAKKAGVTVGTADQPIQDVINAIRTVAAGEACIIRFGNGETPLEIGTASASFSTTGGTWGLIELSGKITGNSTTATVGTIVIDNDVSVTSTADIGNTAANADAKAIYNNSTGTLTISGGEVKANTGRAIHNNSTGKIIVSGTAKVTSANVTAASGTIYIASSGTATTDRLVIEGGTVENSSTNSNARAVYNASTGAVKISGGTVSTIAGYAIFSNGNGLVTISGGEVKATTGSAVYKNSSGTLTISGGEISATTGYAVNNNVTSNYGGVEITGGTISVTSGRAVFINFTNPLTISGGTVSATTGYAVYNDYNGKITVSGTAKITSANTNASQGTIYQSTTGSGTIEITGGTIENTDSGNAINNTASGAINISGGTVSATTGSAIFNNSAGKITLGGSPTITGKITTGTGTLSAATNFTPAAKTYSLDFTNISTEIAVTGGASYLSNFILANNVVNGITFNLIVQNSNLILKTEAGYKVDKSGTTYTITKGSGGEFVVIQDAINNIKTQSNGAACTIQFGNGTDVLDIGGGSITLITFEGWTGLVTLTGKLTSGSTSSAGIIRINNGTIDNKADLTSSSSGYMIYNNSTGTLTISAGAVSATSSYAVYNYNTGTVNITGGSVSATTSYAVYMNGGAVTISNGTVSATSGRAIYNNSNGAITISGGTVSATTGYAVYNNTTGAVNISGGTVQATSDGGDAVYNYTTGTVTISGGIVSATTGRAVLINSNYGSGKTTISGTAKVTSANTNTTQGTIQIQSSSGTIVGLEILGGTVENTSTAANGNAVYNTSNGPVTISNGTVSSTATSGRAIFNNSTGAVTVNGGTVSVTGTSARAIHNYSTGAVTITAGAVTAPVNSTAYSIYNASTGVVSVTGGTITGNRYPTAP